MKDLKSNLTRAVLGVLFGASITFLTWTTSSIFFLQRADAVQSTKIDMIIQRLDEVKALLEKEIERDHV